MTLLERLEELTMREVSDGVYCREMPVPVNRDGPEAAARIEALEAALEDSQRDFGNLLGYLIPAKVRLVAQSARDRALKALLSDGDSGEGRA